MDRGVTQRGSPGARCEDWLHTEVHQPRSGGSYPVDPAAIAYAGTALLDFGRVRVPALRHVTGDGVDVKQISGYVGGQLGRVRPVGAGRRWPGQARPAKRSRSGTGACVVSITRTKVSSPISCRKRWRPSLRKKMSSAWLSCACSASYF